GISPKWSASHAFQAGLSVGPNAEGVVNAQKGVLTYTIATGGVHKFYAGTSFAQIDNPASPAGGTSLVSKSYVDQHVTSATVQPGAPKPVAVSIGNTVSAGTATTYLRSDAVLGLDQGISPNWTAAHTYHAGLNLSGASTGSFNVQQGALAYTIATGGVHQFYVGANAVAQIDNPASPTGPTSLVSRAYVDAHSGSGSAVQPGTPKPVAVSIGNAVSAGTATTYMRSDAVLGLDQSISPKWTGLHAFQTGMTVGPNAVASFYAQPGALKYTIASGGVHAFYVAGNSVAQIDDPNYPLTDRSLVSKWYLEQYVAQHGGPGSRLDMIVSAGAPKLDPTDLTGFTPSNTLTIYGPAGLRYIVLVDDGATVADGAQTSVGYYIFAMGADQVKRLALRMPSDSRDLGLSVRVAPHSLIDGADQNLLAIPPIQKTAEFFPMMVPPPTENFALIESWGYTRGVPCDGTVSAQIYVVVDAGSSVSELAVDVVGGAASFDPAGKLTHTTVSINKKAGQPDGWAIVDVYSKTAGVTKIQVSAAGVKDVVFAYPSFVQPVGQ
ncbi:MAG TPA: hypothetical protein VL635_06580, partial [Trinickia sp.]|nr:hypothetical protein [Trinickia sp.]